MTITPDTKIATLIKHHPDALETIVSISQKFSKLRNPVLRKMMAGRTSIAMASKLGGCNVEDFFTKLQPLGFTIAAANDQETLPGNKIVPGFLKDIDPGKFVELDVRPVIETGKDPLTMILQKVKELETGSVLKIINSFEPVPLMNLLAKKGFQSYAENVDDELVYTYFYKSTSGVWQDENKSTNDSEEWDQVLDRFHDDLVTVDVRALEMPQPMHMILEALAKLQPGKALFVHHKRIPVFLLPELEEQQFSYRIKEIGEGEVKLLIYKD